MSKKQELVDAVVKLIDNYFEEEKRARSQALEDAAYSVGSAFDALYDVVDMIDTAKYAVEEAKNNIRDLIE